MFRAPGTPHYCTLVCLLWLAEVGAEGVGELQTNIRALLPVAALVGVLNVSSGKSMIVDASE